MDGKPVRSGPTALTAVTTINLLNPPTLAGGTGLAGSNAATYLVVRHMRVANKTAGTLFVALWLGLTGANTAGTEAIWAGAATASALNGGTGVPVGGNNFIDWFGYLRLDTADFLVGGASAVGLTFMAEATLYIV